MHCMSSSLKATYGIASYSINSRRPTVTGMAQIIRIFSLALLACLLGHAAALAQEPQPCAYNDPSLHENLAAPGNLSIQSELNWRLANQWITPEHVDRMLRILQLLISSTNPLSKQYINANKSVLGALENLDPDYASLFVAAMGNPDQSGRPSVPPPANLLDALSKANLLSVPPDDNAKQNFQNVLSICTTAIIVKLYSAHAGAAQPEIVTIDSDFQNGGGSNYVALSRLLSAYHYVLPDPHALADLEILRAEFKNNPIQLAKIIHQEVSGAQN